MLDHLKNLREQPRTIVWILVALFAVVLLVQFIQVWQTARDGGGNSQAEQRGATIADYDSTVILERDLFGTASAQPSATQSGVAPVTKLALTLQAIFNAPNPENSNAIIAGPDGSAKNYRVGAILADNTTVERIDPDQVVLNRDGQIEALRFPQPGMATSRTAQQPDDELSKQDYSQLLSSLSARDRKKAMQKIQGGGDMRSLLQALPPEQKLKVVRKRLEQLRQQSSKKKR